MKTSTLYTPEQNGSAERGNRAIVEMGRSMLLARNLPTFLWAKATAYSVYKLNRIPDAKPTSHPTNCGPRKKVTWDISKYLVALHTNTFRIDSKASGSRKQRKSCSLDSVELAMENEIISLRQNNVFEEIQMDHEMKIIGCE